MYAAFQFAVLVIATMFAAIAAVLLDWILLRATFQLMRPATAPRSQVFRTELVQGTRELTRYFAGSAARR